ncbi:winged helix-turn-helix domain-containing protein [Streptomyces sp. NPDC087659]
MLDTARDRGLIARRFHVRFSVAQVSRILHQMGWSVQVTPTRQT